MAFKLVQQIATFIQAKSRPLMALFVALSCFFWSFDAANAASRVKDIAEFEGIRDNILVGYGLVVGLNGRAIHWRTHLSPNKASPRCWNGSA